MSSPNPTATDNAGGLVTVAVWYSRSELHTPQPLLDQEPDESAESEHCPNEHQPAVLRALDQRPRGHLVKALTAIHLFQERLAAIVVQQRHVLVDPSVEFLHLGRELG